MYFFILIIHLKMIPKLGKWEFIFWRDEPENGKKPISGGRQEFYNDQNIGYQIGIVDLRSLFFTYLWAWPTVYISCLLYSTPRFNGLLFLIPQLVLGTNSSSVPLSLFLPVYILSPARERNILSMFERDIISMFDLINNFIF